MKPGNTDWMETGERDRVVATAERKPETESNQTAETKTPMKYALARAMPKTRR
jgi:hypothetical protein